jgi:hypothetical protein
VSVLFLAFLLSFVFGIQTSKNPKRLELNLFVGLGLADIVFLNMMQP